MGYLRWYGDNMWLFVPVQAKLKEALSVRPASMDPRELEQSESRNRALGKDIELLQRQRESLDELLGRRGKVEAQLESCVLAVQNVRFDLLRLRSAGVQEVLSDLTSATQAARAMQIDVEAALDAASEIRDALGRGKP